MPSTLTITPYNPPAYSQSISVQNVSIDGYKSEPVLAADRQTPTSVKVSLSGSGIVTAADWNALRASLQQGGVRCKTVTLVSGSTDLINLSSDTSVLGTPIAVLSATEIVGTNLAMLKFEITDERSFSTLPVTAHTWTQRIQLDNVGRPTRTVNGHLRVYRNYAGGTTNAYATAANWAAEAPWADWFRSAAVPLDLRQGWRRESQEYALSDDGTELVYTVIDRLYAHDLPDGVRVGDMDFSYERSLENPAVAQVSFTCELEGGLDLRGIPGNAAGVTGNRALVAAAVQLSRTRLDATASNVLMQRMKVTERNILSGFSIRFEVDAQLLPNGDPTGNSIDLQPLAAMIGRHFHVVRTTSRTIGAYGVPRPVSAQTNQGVTVPSSGDVYAMLQHYLFIAGDSSRAMPAPPATQAAATKVTLDAQQSSWSAQAMPCAQVIAFTDDCLFGNITQTGDAGLKVYLVASSATSTLAMNEYVQGKFVRAITQETAGTIVSYNAASTQVDIDSGMRVLPRMSNYLPDAVYQTSHPVVTVRERAEIVQLNVAPGRYMRPVPTGGVVLGETWNVSLGRFDAQGNRQFVAVWERRVRQRAISDYTTYNSADKSGFAVTQSAAMIDRNGSTAAPAFGDYVAWQPSAVALNPPQSDIISTTAQDVTASVLDPLSTGTPADADAAYRIDRLARKYQRSLS